MTEEIRQSYDSGEVVWVKLGSSWWPGEVKDAEELPSDVQDFKKPPLVIVKFFDEDSYEYVKSWTSIYPYDCDKKNEFIKKGMAAFRAKIPHMEKFPKDVLQAEEKIGGNPNILSNPMFLPEKKRNYAAEIFGTPSPKNNTPKNKKRSSTNKSGSKKDTSHITHRRFLGVDDYRAYILIQYPGKDRIPGDREDEEVIRINREPEQAFNCHSCSFSTKRLEVMILHTKSHIQGVYQSSARRGKQSAPRRKKEKSKRARGSDVADSDTTSSDSEPIRQKKRKPKSQGIKKMKVKKVEEEVQEEVENKKTDIRRELLEAWEESDEEDLDFSLANLNSSTATASRLFLGDKSDVTDLVDRSETVDQNATLETGATDEVPGKPDTVKSPSQTLEEALNDVSGELEDSSSQSELTQPAEEQLSTEKLLSTLQDDSLDADDEVRAIDDKKTKGDDEEDAKSDKKEGEISEDKVIDKKAEADEDTPQHRINKDVQEAIKSCFDFDEDDEEDSTIVGKADSGRKIPRVIPKALRKNSETDGKEKESGEDMDAAFKELMEITAVPDLPDVQNSLKCEQNFHNIKTIKFPDKPEQVGSPPKPERKDSTEVATKLTNPKKRFVKSFEDFELMQNEIRRKEEEQRTDVEPKADVFSALSFDYLDNSEDQDSPESNIELSKLKSKIMSKIIEEAKINPESKSRIMSKIQDPKHKTAESEIKPKVGELDAKRTNNQDKAVSSHRTPRSKILESYRKDTSKRQSQEERDASPSKEETRQDNQADVVPPKKSIWSRRGSHPKKDKAPISIVPPPVRTASVKAVLEMRKQAARSRRQNVVEEPKTTPVIEDASTKEVLEEEEEKPTVDCVESQPSQVEAKSPKAEELPASNAEAEHSEESPLQAEPLNESDKSCLDHDSGLVQEPNVIEEVPHLETSQTEEASQEPAMAEEEVKRPETEPEVEKPEESSNIPAAFSAKEEISQTTVEEVPPEIDVGTKPCLEQGIVTEDPVTEEQKVPSPPEVVEPPEETVASPKGRKRKLSEPDLTHSPVKDPEAEPLSDTEISAKKRLNEAEASPQLLENFLVETEKEVTAENDTNKDLPEVKETPMESEPEKDPQPVKDEVSAEVPMEVQQDKDEQIEKSDKESDLDTKKEEREERKEEEVENKPEAEHPAQKDAAEKEPESLEMEVAVEKPLDVETGKVPDTDVQDHNNEVEIHCASSSMDSFKFSIQTNLSILSSREEMSALALATLSEMKADLESNEDVIPKEEEEEQAKPEPPPFQQPELVPIEGNLTVVSEKDLADGQVEITSDQVISPKRPVTLSSFSLDFSDSFSDSNSNSTTDISMELAKGDFNSKGTEFTAKALTKQMKKLDHKKESTYGRLELINILEGNSDADKKPKEVLLPPKKASVVDDICDFEEHIPSQIVCAKNLKKDSLVEQEPDLKESKKEKTSKTSVKSTTSKLLERLTTESKAKASAAKPALPTGLLTPAKDQNAPGATPKPTRFIVKPKSSPVASKPIVLPEKVLKPAPEVKPKPMEDIEDVEAFVIHKDLTKINFEDEEAKSKTASSKMAGKAKILQQTIITPAGEIIQPTVSEPQTDDNIFDINSMPIVLSDEIFTPESIEKMPIVIGSDTKAAVPEKLIKRPTVQNRIVTTMVAPENKTVTFTKHKPPRILQTLGNKVVKNSPLLPSTAKAGKYIIVPQSSIPSTKYVPKKPTLIKKTPVPTKIPNIAPEPSGNKIMVVTNQQGQQQRLLLTPAQQKMLGYQNQKVTKTIVKGNVMQKSVFAKGVSLAEAGTSGVISKTSSLIGQKVLVTANQSLIKATSPAMGAQGRITKTVTKRSLVGVPKSTTPVSKPQKTILIKDQHGQTVRKIQGTDDELLDKQVAEQLKAIKASSGMKFSLQQKPGEGDKASPKTTVRRSYSKRVEVKPRGPPPLTIQQSSKQETVVSMPKVPISKKMELLETKASGLLTEEAKTHQPDRPLNQLVIQDAVGNQTTITEGQILALPSETVDGQPQSYMLVTLDESGNLTPLNSEALMSLDPNLGLGGDLSNMVLQIDQSALSDRPQTAIIKPSEIAVPAKAVEVEPLPQPVPEPPIETVPEQKPVTTAETLQPVTPSTNGDPGQQLIVTGDPIATQKFLESLTEGTTDLANILANADGNSILIQADGQQILINTNTDNQMLLSVNNDNVNVTENTEGGGNPIFATQPSKNQDILAAALADTDVFQQEHPSSSQNKIGSQLSPNNALYPMNVGNVLETSLTLSSPIMSPLEVPSTNNKKIPDDEADILKQVPKNVDLPITITDPNISQTVANQQMLANELQELALPISESAPSTEMNSPSYAYSLPALDDSVGMAQKPFNGSMPLLNEDVEEAVGKARPEEEAKPAEDKAEGFLSEEEGRFTLGGEMCSSLSEPPPEMFELPEVPASNVPSLQSTPDASENASKDEDTTDVSQADTSSEGSCEIPVQPQIVTKSMELSRSLDSLKRSLDEAEGDSKKCKFD